MSIVYIVLIIIAIALVLTLLVMGYVKAAPDEAIIISGFFKKPRILIGRAGFRIPFFERVDRLTLRQVTVDIKTGADIPTRDFINVQVNAVAKVREKAMKNFLNKEPGEIIMDLQDSLQGNMREIVRNNFFKRYLQ